MRLVAGDGEFGFIAIGAVPVGIIAIGGAPIGVVAFGPLATGVIAGSVGLGWIRGVVGGVCGAGVVTCWRSYICGGGLCIGAKSLIVGLGLSIDAYENEGMSLSWSWKSTPPSLPSLAKFREWRAWRKRRRDLAPTLLRDGGSGVVLVDPPSDVLGEDVLSSDGVVIDAAPRQVMDVRAGQAVGRRAFVEVAVEESMEQDGYRSVTRERSLRLKKVLRPTTLKLGLGSGGYWVMVAFLLSLAFFVRVSTGPDGDPNGIEPGAIWNAAPLVTYRPAPDVDRSRTMHGRLEPGDQTLQSGEYADAYPVELDAGEEIDLRLSSASFDTYLIIRGPGGEQEDNDDIDEDDSDSSLTYIAAQGGTHRVLATSFGEGETGAYDLVIRREGRPHYLLKGPEQSAEAVEGTLADSDGQMLSGEYRDHVVRSFQAGQLVQVRVASEDFDAYLIASPPSGGQTDNDDLHGTNAGIDILEAEEGEYRFTITSDSPGETGRYTLSILIWDRVSLE